MEINLQSSPLLGLWTHEPFSLMVVSKKDPDYLTFVQHERLELEKGLTLMSSISQIFFTSSMEV